MLKKQATQQKRVLTKQERRTKKKQLKQVKPLKKAQRKLQIGQLKKIKDGTEVVIEKTQDVPSQVTNG